jgi:Na+/H+ antiporter NhaD/arsenite permease-like protein
MKSDWQPSSHALPLGADVTGLCQLARRQRPLIWAGSVLLAGAAALHDPAALGKALDSLLLPFLGLAALVGAGLLADAAGLFRCLARLLTPARGPAALAAASTLGLTALISGLVNLDVAVIAMVPLALAVAERRRLRRERLVLAIALTANACSILLPTSNITNLLVLDRAPEPWPVFLQQSWAAWLAVTAVTVGALTWFVARADAGHGAPTAVRAARLATLVDLAPMYVAASAIKALLGNAVGVSVGFFGQLALAVAIAALANNLPAAAALQPHGPPGRWAGLLGLALGPNVLMTGSFAALIVRGLARGRDVAFSARSYSLVGGALLPLQLAVAAACLAHTGGLP